MPFVGGELNMGFSAERDLIETFEHHYWPLPPGWLVYRLNRRPNDNDVDNLVGLPPAVYYVASTAEHKPQRFVLETLAIRFGSTPTSPKIHRRIARILEIERFKHEMRVEARNRKFTRYSARKWRLKAELPTTKAVEVQRLPPARKPLKQVRSVSKRSPRKPHERRVILRKRVDSQQTLC